MKYKFKIFFLILLIFILQYSLLANEIGKESKINKVKEYVIANMDNYDFAAEIYDYIRYYSKEYKVEEELIAAVIKIESNYDVVAVSPVGAIGLMQLMPQTADYLNVNATYIPENIRGGVKYLSECLRKNANDKGLALASYNAGIGAVQKFSSIPPYSETQNYVEKVLKEYNSLKDEKYIHGIVEFKADLEMESENDF